MADEEGFDALSMRKLAQRLGVEAMSIYYHVENKDALLDGMIDLIMEFGLERTGHCKYSNAVWLESLFLGWPDPPSYAGDLLVL